MTDSLADEFAAAAEYAPTADGFAVETSRFDARARPDGDVVDLTVELPTLDAVVVGEQVAPVVEDGWYETLERRLEGAPDVTRADVAPLDVRREPGAVVVETTVDPRPGRADDDVAAVVNFVEGTWFSGIVPGYDYEERVQAMRESAASQGGSDDPTPL